MKFIKFIVCLVVAFAIGTASFGAGAGVAFAALSLIPTGAPAGSLRSGLIPEVWTKEFVKRFNHIDQGTFLDGIPDYSQFVRQGNTINLIDFGCDPDVLVNNTDYPIAVQEMDNADIVLTLDKFQTKATPISDDTLIDVKAEFIPAVIEAHRVKISEYRLDKSIYNFAPSKNTDGKTPVFATTGEADETGKRKRFSKADVIALKKKFDEMEVPTQGRRLVLCPDHVADLLMVDQAFQQQYYNYSSGVISKMFGFDIYEYVKMPLYTSAGNKKGFGVAASTGDTMASVAFYVQSMAKATGERRQYRSDASTDPLYQRNLYNVREYFFAAPKRSNAMAAIYSGAVSQ